MGFGTIGWGRPTPLAGGAAPLDPSRTGGRVDHIARIIPSDDAAFRRHVERLTARQRFATPDELASRLRRIFPRVVVRASEVSGQGHVWYVYRDGVWRADADGEWWAERRTPRVVVTLDGWLEEANAPARALLGLAPDDPMPRHFTDFVAPGTLQDASDLFAVVAAGHELSATTVVRPSTGDVIACDLRAWIEDGRIQGALRLADDIPARPTAGPRPIVRLTYAPADDVVFARYADDALARMPEPTPEGLGLRLRRLYPHARVDALDGTWAVSRDAVGASVTLGEWWHMDGLPEVRYDGQGMIFAANAAALGILGPDLIGRHWQELVTPGTTDEVGAVLRMIEEAGWAVSRFRMPGPDGYLFEFDSYTEVVGGSFRTVMRTRSAGADA
jgi:PAS domain-containing protein